MTNDIIICLGSIAVGFILCLLLVAGVITNMTNDSYLNGARDMHSGVLSVVQDDYIIRADDGSFVGRLEDK